MLFRSKGALRTGTVFDRWSEATLRDMAGRMTEDRPPRNPAGRAEDAVKILRQLITAPAGAVVSIARLKIDPVWDPIRNDPGFQKLLSEPESETIYR